MVEIDRRQSRLRLFWRFVFQPSKSGTDSAEKEKHREAERRFLRYSLEQRKLERMNKFQHL